MIKYYKIKNKTKNRTQALKQKENMKTLRMR